jgi:hypothetical protein
LKDPSPWLADPTKESWLILAPSIVPVIVVILFKDYFLSGEVSSLWWVILVLCIDVSHVYSTLFRMYWDRQTFQQYKKLLIVIPMAAFLAGLALHLYSSMLFWRVLAYVAAYHFVRQQYGFMRLYSRKEEKTKAIRIIDSIAIYCATLYPLLYWHLHYTQQLSWFIKGDFIPIRVAGIDGILTTLYLLTIVAYVVKEIIVVRKSKQFNVPKNLIVVGTYASWYVGIVMFQGDLIFTLLNVVAHGIPYMGLIWIYGETKAATRFSFTWKGAAIFLGVLVVLAYFEESIWDAFVWQDHPDVFPWTAFVDSISNAPWLSILVPLLVLPQVTHYVLDGFIWRFSKDSSARIPQ